MLQQMSSHMPQSRTDSDRVTLFGSYRHVFIATSVVLFHLGALWAMQSGLIRRAIEAVIPVEILSEWVEPPRPKIEAPPPTTKLIQQPMLQKRADLPPSPMPIAIADPTPAPAAPVGVVAAPVALAPIAAPVATKPTPAAPSQVVPPSSDADYLQNTKPMYPLQSKRLGEQGKVIVRVLIGVDGLAQKAEVRSSSGYDRLDQSALATVQSWRYVPGKRGGVAEAMWFNVPINFVLE
jgi:protein TonB